MPLPKAYGIAAGWPMGGGGRVLYPVGNRNFLPTAFSTAGGTPGAINYTVQIWNNSDQDIVNPVLRILNTTFDATLTEVPNTNAVVWTASLALTLAGARTQAVSRASGATTLSIAAGASHGDMLVPGFTIPARSVVWLMAYASVGASEQLVNAPGTCFASRSEGRNFANTSGNPDRTLAGSTTPVDGTLPPIWLLGSAASPVKSARIIGDSIDETQKENSAPLTSNANGEQGIACRFFGSAGYNSINCARSSSKAQWWAGLNAGTAAANNAAVDTIRKMLAGISFTADWCGLSRNDLSGGVVPAATLLTYVNAALAKFGTPPPIRVIRDAPPYTTGTFAGVETQTNVENGTGLQNEADWRATLAGKGVAGMTHYFQFWAACVATKSDGSLVWQANKTPDGTHPLALANSDAVTANAGLIGLG